MDYKLIWTDSAISDIKDICSYISRKRDMATAGKVGYGLLKHVKVLENFPFIGPVFPRRSNGSIREIVYGNYRIFYEVTAESKTVHLLRVWHSARDEPPIG